MILTWDTNPAVKGTFKMRWQTIGKVYLASAAAALLLWNQTAFADTKVIKIGAPLALTGALANSGKKQKLGYDLWLDRINKAGGIKVGNETYRVEIVTYDYQTNGKRAGFRGGLN